MFISNTTNDNMLSDTAVNDLLNLIKTKVEENNNVVMIPINMKKTFDVISETNLIKKLFNLVIHEHICQIESRLQTPTTLKATNYLQNTESHRVEIYHQFYTLCIQTTKIYAHADDICLIYSNRNEQQLRENKRGYNKNRRMVFK